ncbi:hypothetical protein P4324_15660 [Bacillus thuringiensis]|nr:hypothetical protein [Bacillus thuringiensis]MED2923473.1 hypothetical protein [Bacillus thuringiensis]MED3047013.1 hypothetical protein [Bacillus thuringiensis]
MGEFTREPGGYRVTDSGGGGAGYEKDPGEGMGMYEPNPSGGYMKDPGTGI